MIGGGRRSGWQTGRMGPAFPHHGGPCNLCRRNLRQGEGREGKGEGVDSGR